MADRTARLGVSLGTVSLGGDLSGSLPNPTVTDLTITSEAHGDLLYRGVGSWLRLAPGTVGHVLTTQGAGAAPTWTAPGGGGDHAALTNLPWTASGHTGTASRIAAFSGAGAASYLAIGTDVQAYSARLAEIAALAVTDGNIIVGDGAAWVAESGATARTSLGLGSGDSPTFTLVTISGTPASSTDAATKGYVDALVGPGAVQTLLPVGFPLAATTVKTMTDGTAFAHYIGKAAKALTTANIRYRITTAATVVVYSEWAICKGTPALGSGVNLTRLGFVNSAAQVTSTGLKTAGPITLSGVAAGDDLYLVYGGDGGVALAVRGGAPDDLTSGRQVAAVGVRPSTMAANTPFALEANTVNPALCTVTLT